MIGKKIITHNGMRALLSSIDSVSKVINKNRVIKVDIQGAYYEMQDALKISGIKAKIVTDPKQADVIVRDINACVTDGRKEKSEIISSLSSSPAKAWIIDTTSASSRKMSELISTFRKSEASVLYLISSGFKNEQFGADRNQYGTIRAFTDSSLEGKKRLDEILSVTRNTDKPLAITAHLFRRVMKSIGAVPRNALILSGSKDVPFQ